jgi:thiol:disulfide interchange protein
MMREWTMRSRSNALAVLVGLLLLLLGQSEAAAFSRAQWERVGWSTEFVSGLTRARATGSPAFVYFDAGWCSWCQQYKRDTLDQPQVRTVLARDFVRVAVDFDARPDLMRRFGGIGLPFTVVLSPDGTVLSRFVGVMQPQDLMEVLGALARRPAPPSALAVAPARSCIRPLRWIAGATTLSARLICNIWNPCTTRRAKRCSGSSKPA